MGRGGWPRNSDVQVKVGVSVMPCLSSVPIQETISKVSLTGKDKQGIAQLQDYITFRSVTLQVYNQTDTKVCSIREGKDNEPFSDIRPNKHNVFTNISIRTILLTRIQEEPGDKFDILHMGYLFVTCVFSSSTFAAINKSTITTFVCFQNHI